MPRLRNLSGGDVLQILRDFGFKQSSQRGSHVTSGWPTLHSNMAYTIQRRLSLPVGSRQPASGTA